MDQSKMTEIEALQKFKKITRTTKSDLLKGIALAKDDVLKAENVLFGCSVSFQKNMCELIDRFYEQVAAAQLFEDLEDWWGYKFVLGESGIRLFLCHYPGIRYDEYLDLYIPDTADAEYLLIEEKARQLSVEEFAEKCNVEAVTVRQWIRRGKLAGVSKKGKEWQIPELTEKPERGYEGREYYWKNNNIEWPIGYDFLKKNDALCIDQHPKDPSKFLISYVGDVLTESKIISSKEREKFEMFLITNPDIFYRKAEYIVYY